MTITRIAQAGGESTGTGSLLEFSGVGGGGESCSNAQAKTGSYSFLAPARGYATGPYWYWVVPSTLQLRTGFWFYTASVFQSDWNGDARSLNIRSAALGELITLTPQYGTMEMKVHSGGVDRGNITLPTGWCHIGVDAKFAASGGWVTIYLNGIAVKSVTGNTGTTPALYLFYGAAAAGFGAIRCGATYFDDLYVDDTTGEVATAAVPALRFGWMQADGDGNYSDMLGSDGNRVSNYALVDDNPKNDDTDRVEADAAHEKDSYVTATYTVPTQHLIRAVIPLVYARKTGTLGTLLALGTRLAGVDLVGADQSPSMLYLPLWERQVAKPGGGDWLQADVDAVEVYCEAHGVLDA